MRQLIAVQYHFTYTKLVCKYILLASTGSILYKKIHEAHEKLLLLVKYILLLYYSLSLETPLSRHKYQDSKNIEN